MKESKRPDPFDSFNGDSLVDRDDRDVWIKDLKVTWIGDSNLDGEFDSTDFVLIFQAGEFEDSVALNSNWSTGDWNGDGDITSGDFVDAFQDGGFELGPRAAVQSVPEPTTGTWTILLLCLAIIPSRRRHCEIVA